jgi:geranylgeranyl transferase type-1 subunit beta
MEAAKTHARFFQALLESLPEHYVSLETTRLTAVYFCVVGLDILGELETVDKDRVVAFILSNQVFHDTNGGFIGSPFLGQPFCANGYQVTEEMPYVKAHIAATYSALAALATLGYDLQQLNKDNILRGNTRISEYLFAVTRS